LFRTGHDCGRHPYQLLVVDAVGYVPRERPAANMLSVLAPTTRAVLIVRSLSKPLRFRDKSWNSIPPSAQQEPANLQAFRDDLQLGASACHAEGRGFESHQPLRGKPRFSRS
jgi:hypothetical protein